MKRAYFKIIIMPYYCYSYHMSTRILPSQFAQSTNISKPYQCCTVWEYADYQLWRTRKDSIYQGEEVYLWYDIKRLSSLWKLLWMWRSVFLNINIYCKKKRGGNFENRLSLVKKQDRHVRFLLLISDWLKLFI